MSFTLPNNINNGDPIDADKVMANFNKLKTETESRAVQSEIIKTLNKNVFSTLIVGKNSMPIIIPENFTITEVTSCVGSAPTGSDIILDIHDNSDVTIFSTQSNRPTISDGNNKGTVTTPDVASLTKENILWLYIDQVGSTTPGSDLALQIRGIKT